MRKTHIRTNDIGTLEQWFSRYEVNPLKQKELMRRFDFTITHAKNLLAMEKGRPPKREKTRYIAILKAMHDAVNTLLSPRNKAALCEINADFRFYADETGLILKPKRAGKTAFDEKRINPLLHVLDGLRWSTAELLKDESSNAGRPKGGDYTINFIVEDAASALFDSGLGKLVTPSQSGPFDKLITILLDRAAPCKNQGQTFRRYTERAIRELRKRKNASSN
jgi:hypothetical protein